MKTEVIEAARQILSSDLPAGAPIMVMAQAIVDDAEASGCKGGPRDMPKGPWKAVKVNLNSEMLFKIVSGEHVVIEHRKLPADADLLAVRQNGVEVEMLVGSQTYDARTCLCAVPVLRVNYSSGG